MAWQGKARWRSSHQASEQVHNMFFHAWTIKKVIHRTYDFLLCICHKSQNYDNLNDIPSLNSTKTRANGFAYPRRTCDVKRDEF